MKATHSILSFFQVGDEARARGDEAQAPAACPSDGAAAAMARDDRIGDYDNLLEGMIIIEDVVRLIVYRHAPSSIPAELTGRMCVYCSHIASFS